MGRVSTKEKKTVYQQRREELGLSREKASELLEGISPERIERIESEKLTAYPEEVVMMAEKYKDPLLCNHYCANECAIGKRFVPEVKIKDLTRIVLEMLASFYGDAAADEVSQSRVKINLISKDGSRQSLNYPLAQLLCGNL